MTMISQVQPSTAGHGLERGRTSPIGAVQRPVETRAVSEHRSATRLPAPLVPTITGVRLRPHGDNATLLNISSSGVLVECTGRLRLGTAVTVVFEGTFSPASIDSRVARISVATVDKTGVLRYHIGISFNNPITLDEAPATAKQQPETALQLEAAFQPETVQPETVLQAEMGLPPQVATPPTMVIGNRW